ncbi:MAG: sugar ABC transporter permease [Geminicoccaceae bacterium]|nr:sugar ABC transporter permease [Geminicoccaceae bacterium]
MKGGDGGRRARDAWAGWFLVAFFTLPFLLFNLAPLLFGIVLAFTEWGIIGDPVWVGTANFERALADPWVANAFLNTFWYAAIIVPGVVVLGLLTALLVDRRWPLAGLARTFFFTPNVVPATVIGLVWVWLLDTRFGLVNQYLGLFGIAPVPWLTSGDWSLIGVALASIWWDLGLAFILFLAALQDVPEELHEAAAIDGAGPLRRFWHVTLPHLRPTLSMVVTLQVIASMRIFSQVYVMTNGAPHGSSQSVIHYIYQTAIVQFRLGYASAVSVLLFLAILAITILHRLLLAERARGAG